MATNSLKCQYFLLVWQPDTQSSFLPLLLLLFPMAPPSPPSLLSSLTTVNIIIISLTNIYILESLSFYNSSLVFTYKYYNMYTDNGYTKDTYTHLSLPSPLSLSLLLPLSLSKKLKSKLDNYCTKTVLSR